MTEVEVDEVQGNVLYAYGDDFPHARYVLFRVNHATAAKANLRGWLDQITFGLRPWDRHATGDGDTNDDTFNDVPPQARDSPHLNIAFTFSGLQALGVAADVLYAFPDEFRQGARARAAGNGDVAGSAPENWVGELGRGHLLLVVYARSEEDRDRLVERLMREAQGGMTPLHDLPASRLHSSRGSEQRDDSAWQNRSQACDSRLDREHFGFADGCSQPAVEGVNRDPTGSGVYARTPPRWWRPFQPLELALEDLGLKPINRRWRAICAGEFLLGYENEEGTLPVGPPDPIGRNGTFMVYRPMSQDVETFSRHIESEAERLGFEPDLLRAKIVGRWRDGTPLALSPERPDDLIADNRRRANDFLYQESRNGFPADPDGYGCPLGAHIRRSNPRDALPGGGERTMGHRIIRRGMPYGRRETSEDCGLAFVCFSSSIANGFEFIQRTWCNSGSEIGLGSERDPILQQSDPGELTGMVIPSDDNRTVVMRPPEKPFVTVRGCEYLFVPSRRGFEWLTNV